MLKKLFGFLADLAWMFGFVNLGAKFMVRTLETENVEQVKVHMKLRPRQRALKNVPAVIFEDKVAVEELRPWIESLGVPFEEINFGLNAKDVN